MRKMQNMQILQNMLNLENMQTCKICGLVVFLAMFFPVHPIVNDGLQIVIAIAALDDICFAMELPLSPSPGFR